MTWKLWQALKRPPTRHHLFRRTFAATDEPFPWYIGCSQFLALIFIVPILAFAGAIYGMGWAVGVSNVLGKERQRKSFDLLSLSPSGPLGISWALSLGYLYHHRTFRNINDTFNLLLRLSAGTMLLVPVVLIVNWQGDGFNFFTFVLSLAALWVALYLDHVQSLLLAPLVGIAVTLLTDNRLNAQLYAFAAYTGLQLMTYLVTLLVGFVIVPGLFAWFGLPDGFAVLLLIPLRLGLFYAVREAQIALLWGWLTREMTTDPVDLEKIAGRKFSWGSLL